jgi:hypothetical protein
VQGLHGPQRGARLAKSADALLARVDFGSKGFYAAPQIALERGPVPGRRAAGAPARAADRLAAERNLPLTATRRKYYN